MEFTEPVPFLEAIRIAQERQLLPTNLSSAQIAEWDDELKRLSVFSARTNHAGYLQGVKDTTESLLQGEFNEATARAKLQDLLDSLGYDPQRGGFPGLEDPNIPPAEPGSLRDLSSDKRTQLVLRTQMRQMANRGYREQGTTRQALFTFPAWELIRIYPRKVPRDNWPERWAEAGGEIYAGRMIAVKDSPVWTQLGSRDLFDDAIGTDYPPFAFNSGMGWRQVSREVCKSLGVPFQDKPKPPPAPRLDDTQISVKGLDRAFLKKLKEDLDLEIRDGVARLQTGSKISSAVRVLGPGVAGGEIEALASTVSSSAQIQATEESVVARINGTYGALDGVHGDGPLLPIPITTSVPAAPVGQAQKIFGQYRSVENMQGEALGIDLFAEAENLEFSLVHENGHWLDDVGIASPEKWASQSSPLLDPWRQAVARSAAYQSIMDDPILSTERREYLLRGRELWARSYAQFIAEESQHPALISSLRQNVRYLGEQWEPNDFEPISAAIRQLFINLGWMRPPAI